MVGWGFAFKKGIILWLWCILWVIVGVVIFVAISLGSVLLLAGVLLDPTSEALAPEAFARTLSQMIIGAAGGVLVGSLIGVIGMFASVVKVVTDAVEEQMRKRTVPEVVGEPTVSPAPSVVQSCPNCGRQIVDPSVIYCPECGAKITE